MKVFKKNLLFYAGIATFSFCFCLSSCKNENPFEYDTSNAAQDSIAKVTGVLPEISDKANIAALAGPDQAGQVWKRLFKVCGMENDLLKHPFYFGLSNVQGLGALFSQQGGPVLGTKRLEYMDSVVRNYLVYSKGDTSSCSQSIDLDIDFSTLLSASWKNPAISGSLSGDFNRAKDIKSTVKHWHTDVLAFDQFIKKLNADKGNNTDLNNYYNFLNGNYLCTQAIWVDTFQTVFILNDTISVALKAQIDSGAITANFGGANASISFASKGRDTIIASTNTSFVVFGKLDKIKLKQQN